MTGLADDQKIICMMTKKNPFMAPEQVMNALQDVDTTREVFVSVAAEKSSQNANHNGRTPPKKLPQPN